MDDDDDNDDDDEDYYYDNYYYQIIIIKMNVTVLYLRVDNKYLFIMQFFISIYL